jgi:hypothetical protein
MKCYVQYTPTDTRFHKGFYISGSASHMSDPAERPPQDTNTASQGKGLSTSSHLFVLNVFNVGHPGEAQLYSRLPKWAPTPSPIDYPL